MADYYKVVANWGTGVGEVIETAYKKDEIVSYAKAFVRQRRDHVWIEEWEDERCTRVVTVFVKDMFIPGGITEQFMKYVTEPKNPMFEITIPDKTNIEFKLRANDWILYIDKSPFYTFKYIYDCIDEESDVQDVLDLVNELICQMSKDSSIRREYGEIFTVEFRDRLNDVMFSALCNYYNIH